MSVRPLALSPRSLASFRRLPGLFDGTSRARSRPPRGFTMVELFAVVMLIGLLVSLLLPAVQSAREMARRTSCANNLLQINLATLAYHNAFEQFPTQLSGTDGSVIVGADNDRRLSALVGILPFLDQRNLYEKIQRPLPRRDGAAGPPWGSEWMLDPAAQPEAPAVSPEADWVAGGPEPFHPGYPPWISEVSAYRCPSDPGIGSGFGRSNFAVCLGDGVVASDSGPMVEVNGKFVEDEELLRQTSAAMRGVFVPRVVTRLEDVTDGQANTILWGEIATDLGDEFVATRPVVAPGVEVLRDQPNWARGSGLIDPDRPRFWDRYEQSSTEVARHPGWARGMRWADGMPLYTGFQTILPPNREIVLSADRDDTSGVMTASSRHQGGAHVGLVDGSVKFIMDSIDSGDTNRPTVYAGSVTEPGSKSPYGVWGAMGTRASGELVFDGESMVSVTQRVPTP